MGLRTRKSITERHTNRVVREVNKRIFVLAEGEKAEVKYFEGLKNHSKEVGISDLLEIVPLFKNPEAKGVSNPNGLAKLAIDYIDEKKYEEEGIFYDEEIDKFLIVFDRDKEDFLNYKEFVDKHKDRFILGISNPCFELWLLLHKENAVEEIINVHRDEILENCKVSNTHTFTSKKASDVFNMNFKRRLIFLRFKDKLRYAIAEEKKLEQDIYALEGSVGCNIGKIIEQEMLRKES